MGISLLCFGAKENKTVKICEEWRNNSNTFVEWSLDNGFNLHNDLSIDRKDNDGNYTPENCQWIPVKLNCKKNRHTKMTMEDAEFIRENRDKYTSRQFREIYKVSKTTIDSILRGIIWNLDETTLKWVTKNNIAI